MCAAGNEPEAKIDYWYRHTSTVLAVTTVRHRPELSLVCQDGRRESMPSAVQSYTQQLRQSRAVQQAHEEGLAIITTVK